VRKGIILYLCTQNTIDMPVSFTLEKRTNLHDECPIRISWSFVGERYQTTMGVSIKKEDWDEDRRLVKDNANNHSEQSADEINFLIKRVSTVVTGIEQDCVGSENIPSKDMMKQAIRDALSNDIARPEDIIERCIEGISSVQKPTERYYRDVLGKYYQFLCDAKHIQPAGGCFYILQELFGRRGRIAVPLDRFTRVRDGIMYSTPFVEVSKEEVFGR
jgi:hypothetical protein